MRRRHGWLLLLLGTLNADAHADEGGACAAEGAEGADGMSREGRAPSVPPLLGNLVRYAQSVEHATAAEGTFAVSGVPISLRPQARSWSG
jgi:hypothetical protein